jgi:hypothetical protein
MELTVPPNNSSNLSLNKRDINCDYLELDLESWLSSYTPIDPNKVNLENLAADMQSIGIDTED